MSNANPTLYDNFSRVKDWSVEKFVDKVTLAYQLDDVAFSGDYSDLSNTPDLSVYTTYAYVTGYVSDAVADLVNSAPAALDTLKELADALGDDPNFATTVTNELSYKANSSDVYSKSDIQGMSYITMADVSAQSYLTSIPSEYITESELSACSYQVALTVSEMQTLFPLSTD